MSSILDKIKERSGNSGPTAEPQASGTPPQVLAEANPAPLQGPANLAAVGDEFTEIRRLLPPQCTLADLREELALLPGDIRQIEESKTLVREMRGRDAFYQSSDIAKHIVAKKMPWKRTQLSLDRERYSFEDLINDHSQYPGDHLDRMLGVSVNNLCFALKLDANRTHPFPSLCAGGVIKKALRVCQEKNIPWRLDAATVRSGVAEINRRNRKPPEVEIDDVDKAVRDHRLTIEEEQSDAEFALRCEWGRLVSLRGQFAPGQLARVAEISVKLDLKEGQYKRDVEVLQECDRLQAMTDKEFLAETERIAAKAKKKFFDLRQEEIDLPKRQQAAKVEYITTATKFKEAVEAPAEIAKLQEKFPYLFQDHDDETAESVEGVKASDDHGA